MIENKEQVITLSNLTRYDSNIKKWVNDRIDKSIKTSIVFIEKENFPEHGDVDTLYVTVQDGLFLWDGNNNSYIAITNQTEDNNLWQWGSF